MTTTTTSSTSSSSTSTHGPRPMGRNLVWCTFGTFKNNYDMINLEPFCDFGFIPFYTRGRDSFLDDSHPIAQKMIEKATRSVNTSYLINVPHRNVSLAARDIDEAAGKAKMVEYWTAKRIYHYAVLDLEIKPWSNLNIQNEVKAVFDLLKKLRTRQEELKRDYPNPPAPDFGFVVLGIRIWPANQATFLPAVSLELRNFPVDGFVPWTHFTENEITAGYPTCWTSGASPLDLTGANNTNILGAYQVMDWVNRSTEWNLLPSLSVSFSLCTRIYNASGAKKIDNPCVGVETFSSAEACDASVYENISHPIIEPFQYYSPHIVNRYGELVAYHLAFHFRRKLCLVKRRYKELEISIALFDVECEDWQRNCTGRNGIGLRGTERLRETTPYAHNLTYQYLIAHLSCP